MRLNYHPIVWTPCKCPHCGHEQEAEELHVQERGAKCEACGKPTAPTAQEQKS